MKTPYDVSSAVGPSTIYRLPLVLFTDLYQLTMAQVYHKKGVAHRRSAFHHFVRKAPFNGGFALSTGLGYVIDYLQNIKFDEPVLASLAQLEYQDGTPLFERDFLDYLQDWKFDADIFAMREGTVMFGEPDLGCIGSLFTGQLIETAVSNMLNFQTLVATKFARIKLAAGGDPVLEFALRRAQGLDGALSASRAAYLGGADSSSNVMAHYVFGIPIKGTHAHSSVGVFDGDLPTFMAMAETMPMNTVFLVDTTDTIEGVKAAIEAGKWLRERGYRFLGIRLDSGDLNWLSQQARQLLDEAGFEDAKIYASNDLDEYLIETLKQQGCQITIWAVGTKGGTAYDQPALQGVYKLTAIEEEQIASAEQSAMRNVIKLSEQPVKISIPGILQIRRFYDKQRRILGDMIWDLQTGVNPQIIMVDPGDATKRGSFMQAHDEEDLFVPIFREGELVYSAPSMGAVRDRGIEQIAMLHEGALRFKNAHTIPVGLEQQLFNTRQQLIMDMRGIMEWNTANGG